MFIKDPDAEKEFTELLLKADLLQIHQRIPGKELTFKIAAHLAKKLHIEPAQIFQEILQEEKNEKIITAHSACLLLLNSAKKRNHAELLTVVLPQETIIAKKIAPVKYLFIIVASPDKKNIQLHALLWLFTIINSARFKKELGHQEKIDIKKLLLEIWPGRDDRT